MSRRTPGAVFPGPRCSAAQNTKSLSMTTLVVVLSPSCSVGAKNLSPLLPLQRAVFCPSLGSRPGDLSASPGGKGGGKGKIPNRIKASRSFPSRALLCEGEGMADSLVAIDEERPAGRPYGDMQVSRVPVSRRVGEDRPLLRGKGERFFAPTRNVILPRGRLPPLRRGDACVAPTSLRQGRGLRSARE